MSSPGDIKEHSMHDPAMREDEKTNNGSPTNFETGDEESSHVQNDLSMTKE